MMKWSVLSYAMLWMRLLVANSRTLLKECAEASNESFEIRALILLGVDASSYERIVRKGNLGFTGRV